MLPHLPCAANQLGVVELATEQCFLYSGSILGEASERCRQSKVERVGVRARWVVMRIVMDSKRNEGTKAGVFTHHGMEEMPSG